MIKRFDSGAQVILQDEGAAIGGHVDEKIRDKLGDTGDTRTLIDNIPFKQTGSDCLRFQKVDRRRG